VIAALIVIAMLLHPHRPAAAQQAAANPVPTPVLVAVKPQAGRAPFIRSSSDDRSPAVLIPALTGPMAEAKAEQPNRGLADLPSMLAPPEPVTKQERLLAAIAQRPDQFEILNPAVQELVAQRREAEFFKFFPPPTPQEIYLVEHTPN
jgi:hypothetical protein